MKHLLKGTFGVLAATCVAVIATGGDVTVSIAYDVLVLARLCLLVTCYTARTRRFTKQVE